MVIIIVLRRTMIGHLFWQRLAISLPHLLPHRLVSQKKWKRNCYPIFNANITNFLRTSDNDNRSCTALSKHVHCFTFINATVIRNNISYNKYFLVVLELSARYTAESIFSPGNRSLRVSTNLTSQHCQFANCCNGRLWETFDDRFTWVFINME